MFNCQDANCLIGNYDDANKALGGICEECKVGFWLVGHECIDESLTFDSLCTDTDLDLVKEET